MGRFYWAGILVLGFLATVRAEAYIATVTPSGAGVSWRGSAKLNLAGNPININGISPQSFFTSVVHGLQRWQAGSEGRLGFDYWQGTNPAVYEPNSNYNGLSSIYFASNSNGSTHVDPNVLGLTQVWYNTDTGEILETDVILNDLSFHFTENPQDTSGYGGANAGSARNVFIENVITHELGHAFGLSHSGGLQSTMLFMESPEQSHLGCDELSGINAIYPASDAGSRGGIHGAVVAESGAVIFGAHVVAISRRRGTVLATAMTDKSGHYSIGGLEPGTYFLMAEPYYAGPQALPSYYSGINPIVCNGETFGRTLLMTADGVGLQGVQVGPGGSAEAPQLVARCGSLGGASISEFSAAGSFYSAPVVYSGGAGFGIADRYSGGRRYYHLRALSGHLEVHALAYSLYSPLHPSLELMDANGNPVSAQISDVIFVGDSGFVNYDSALIADDLPAGDYYISLSGTPLNVSQYPAGPLSLDSVPFVTVTGSVNEGAPVLAQNVPFNARCRMEENFAAYSSPPGDPPRHSATTTTSGGGFCGTVSNDSEGSGGGPGGPEGPIRSSPANIAGWLLPWFLMLSLSRIVKLHARQTAVNVIG